jgi:metal-sulfur cluster biosynthetic enzyme
MTSPTVNRQLDEAIIGALREVFDPCSLGQNVPVSIYDMGLVTGWTLRDADLQVQMCVTSPMCMRSPHFVDAAKQKLLALEGVQTVDCQIDPAVLWTPELMTESGRQAVDRVRVASRAAIPLRPRQWAEAPGAVRR